MKDAHDPIEWAPNNMSVLREAGRVENPREVDAINVHRGEDVRISARWLGVVIQAVHPRTTAEAVGTLDDHDSARHVHYYGQVPRS